MLKLLQYCNYIIIVMQIKLMLLLLLHETTEAIAEALQTLKQWNESWTPQFFMKDLSEQEINAVEEIFPGM